ncbi:uncharacterized protein RCC_03651 [Ramularia collo-cygni]|uniref:Uncharacterized protein n=1 Tax=Ramularia collo-cygni TaxID=112498 RepID=A0A2D3UUN7_9PEZI|nr:uncharacterized protein RCC_03651 [Ramularia collo-cygni]CZT17815.1 uncharacterized protein RCC_03651 [Ramularia collo-cygni]
MKAVFITTVALAALAWAAPLSKRQCFVDEHGVQGCIDNPICTIHDDGSVSCISKRDNIQKRQCYVSKDGVQSCIDNPQCHKNEDGSVYCVSKIKRSESVTMEERDALPTNEKRQCNFDEEGDPDCVETPTCDPKEDGSQACVL